MSKTHSISRSQIYYGITGVLIIWLFISIAALLQTILEMNKVQQFDTLPISPQQQAIQQAINARKTQIMQPNE